MCHLELCLRADGLDHPGRARRAVALRARIDEMAPAGSPERERVGAALGWAGRGYWDDSGLAVAREQVRQDEMSEFGEQVTHALRGGPAAGGLPGLDGEDHRAAVRPVAS